MKSRKKTKPGWKYVVNNRMKGSYGFTDYNNKRIVINKRRHKSAKAKRIHKLPNGNESLIDTLVHETIHKDHPRMTEKGVIKLARARLKRMSKSQKSKYYGKLR